MVESPRNKHATGRRAPTFPDSQTVLFVELSINWSYAGAGRYCIYNRSCGLRMLVWRAQRETRKQESKVPMALHHQFSSMHQTDCSDPLAGIVSVQTFRLGCWNAMPLAVQQKAGTPEVLQRLSKQHTNVDLQTAARLRTICVGRRTIPSHQSSIRQCLTPPLHAIRNIPRKAWSTANEFR